MLARIVVLASLTVIPAFVAAQTERSPAGAPAAESVIATRVRSAALFKNGFAFVHREGSVAAGVARARLDAVPLPVHGTLWVWADPDRLAIESVVASRGEIRETVSASTIEQILHANVGRELTLFLGEDERWSGKLVRVGSDDPPQPAFSSNRRLASHLPSAAQLLLLETAEGFAALQVGDVRRVLSEDGPLIERFERGRETVALDLSFDRRDQAQAELSVRYLARGLTWAPSYSIDVTDPETAVLTAKAEVINEVEDLEGATLRFVTGYPNLLFRHVIDPMAHQGDMDAFLDALARRDSPTNRGALTQQIALNVPRQASASFPTAGGPPEGSGVEDLFLYEQADVTLLKGQRGLYPLFSRRVPYEHLYEWEAAESVGDQGRRGRQEGEPNQEEIWHSVRLGNDSGQPWTTAPAMTTKDGQFLGQDILTYAAAGARTTVRITRAVDVQGEATEYETARERDAVRFHGRSYDKVTVSGTLRATNHKRVPVRLEIRKKIQGEVTDNPDAAEIVALTEGLRRVNPSIRLTWSVPLEAGKTTEIGYEYTLFVDN